jgi:ribosome-binding protein aMBF1 (putative translation factor)
MSFVPDRKVAQALESGLEVKLTERPREGPRGRGQGRGLEEAGFR